MADHRGMFRGSENGCARDGPGAAARAVERMVHAGALSGSTPILLAGEDGAGWSIFSRAMPEPAHHAGEGSSATITGRPVSSISRRSRSRSSAPPPVRTMPRSAMSAPSSGGVCSRAILTAETIWLSGSVSASRISLEKW